MNYSDKKRIEKLSDTVRTACKTKQLHESQNMEQAIHNLGGNWTVSSRLSMDSWIFPSYEGSLCIMMGENFMPSRRAWALAHCLGHALLHAGFLLEPHRWVPGYVYKDSAYDRLAYQAEHQEAEFFAACLTMPAREFKKTAEIHSTPDDYEAIPIAEYYNVTLDAAIQRGRWLGLFP